MTREAANLAVRATMGWLVLCFWPGLVVRVGFLLAGLRPAGTGRSTGPHFGSIGADGSVGGFNSNYFSELWLAALGGQSVIWPDWCVTCLFLMSYEAGCHPVWLAGDTLSAKASCSASLILCF
jgi:hypothetical protein